jgi:hypothetical protein
VARGHASPVVSIGPKFIHRHPKGAAKESSGRVLPVGQLTRDAGSGAHGKDDGVETTVAVALPSPVLVERGAAEGAETEPSHDTRSTLSGCMPNTSPSNLPPSIVTRTA